MADEANIPIWSLSAGQQWNAVGAVVYPPFLSKCQAARLERIRQAGLLFDGNHRQYYLDESRSQFNWPEMDVNGRIIRPFITYNIFGLISEMSGELLFIEAPQIRAEDGRQQDALNALVERCNLHDLLITAATDASYEAECFLESVQFAGEVYLRQVPAAEIHPVGPIGPDGQPAGFVRYRVANVGTEKEPIWRLLETTHTPGKITQQVWSLTRNQQKESQLDLAAWPEVPDGQLWAPEVATGIDRNTVVWIPNLRVRGKAVSDYDGALDLQDSVNAANTQIKRVIAKHADPKLAAPESDVDQGTGGLRASNDVYFFRNPDEIPRYITWSAELAAAMQDRSESVRALLIKTRTSPVLLGLKEGAAPDAYKKVRLEAINSLSKATRKAIVFKAGIRRALEVAQDLELTLAGKAGYARGPIAVELRDGIPVDEGDQANTIATLRTAKVMSRRRAVELLLGDPAAVEKELAELDEEAASATPSILFGEPGQTDQSTKGHEGDTNQNGQDMMGNAGGDASAGGGAE